MRQHSKKSYIFFITVILWFIILPVLLNFLLLDGMDIKLHISFEKFNLEDSIGNIGTPENVYGMVGLYKEAIRLKSLFWKKFFVSIIKFHNRILNPFSSAVKLVTIFTF